MNEKGDVCTLLFSHLLHLCVTERLVAPSPNAIHSKQLPECAALLLGCRGQAPAATCSVCAYLPGVYFAPVTCLVY
jgi:hypothetical protein